MLHILYSNYSTTMDPWQGPDKSVEDNGVEVHLYWYIRFIQYLYPEYGRS